MLHPLGLQLCVGWVHPQQQLPHFYFTPKMWERLVLASLQDGLPGFSQGGFGGWKLLGFPCGWRVGGRGGCAAEGRPAPTWVGWVWGSWSHGPWHRWLLGQAGLVLPCLMRAPGNEGSSHHVSLLQRSTLKQRDWPEQNCRLASCPTLGPPATHDGAGLCPAGWEGLSLPGSALNRHIPVSSLLAVTAGPLLD